MSLLDGLLLALEALAAGLAVRKILRDRRAGKCCGCCASCAAPCGRASEKEPSE